MKDQIIRQLHCLDARIARALEKLYAAQEVCEATGGNGRIIRYLLEHEHEPIYQKDIERAFGITRSTASRVIGLMDRKGLVARNGVAHDARLKQVTLTDRARALGLSMGEASTDIASRLLSGFSEEETKTLHHLLDRMRKNLE